MLKLRMILSCLGAVGLLSCAYADDALPCYEQNWQSLSRHDETPEWLSDAKLGIYFHWGVYTVPAFVNEWYAYSMYRHGNSTYNHHIKTYGKDFNYHDFVKDFKGEHFDAKEWAQLFKAAGARFAGPCAIHHDGFAMWDSTVNPWNAADRGPQRDVTGELLAELKQEGLKTITTFHHARTLQRNADKPDQWASSGVSDCGYDSHFAYDPERATSSTDPELAKMYGNMPADQFYQYWFDEIREVVDQYSPDIVWFDSWLNFIPEEHRQHMAAYYYNEALKKKQQVTIAFKESDMPIEVGINDIEQGGKKECTERTWMTDVTISLGSWAYVEGQKYKSPDLVLRNMIDVWSKNGIVLLNISPMSNGVIPEAQREILLSIGDWLHQYGEAVYNTVPFEVHGFGVAKAQDGSHGGQSATTLYTADDVRFTCSKDKKTMYVFFLGKPKTGVRMTFGVFGPHRHPTPGKVKRATVLGSDVEVKYELTGNNGYLTIPDHAPLNEMATVIKLEME